MKKKQQENELAKNELAKDVDRRIKRSRAALIGDALFLLNKAEHCLRDAYLHTASDENVYGDDFEAIASSLHYLEFIDNELVDRDIFDEKA